ncbi:MAG: hypothetical protein IJ875_04200 [Solobacterium sp.]|nr:hypothetical protein [Solobacterium sp.]
MKLIIEKPLKTYMEEENLSGIVLEVGECIACGGGYKNVNAYFLKEKGEIDESKYFIEESEVGKIYFPKEGILYGDTVRLVWKSYYWEGLGVSGAKAIQEKN